MSRKLPAKSLSERLPGLLIVVLLHLAIGWALFSGLARKAVDQVFKEPLEVALIDMPKPVVVEPPPPPQPPKPPTPKPRLRPKPASKPVDVPAEQAVPVPAPAPAPAAPTPSAVQSTERTPESGPAATPAPPAPPAPPPQVAIGLACPNHISVRSGVPYPSRAERRGISGRVVAEFTVAPNGELQNARIASSSDAIFNDVVLAAVQRFKCIGQGTQVRVRIPFEFTLN